MSDLTDEEILTTRKLHGLDDGVYKDDEYKKIRRIENMSICLKCGKYPFCYEIEDDKKECNKFIKRKLESEVNNDNSKSR